MYRFELLSSFLASIMEFFVMLCIWLYVFQAKSSVGDFSFPQMITYLCISQGITSIYGWNNAVERRVFLKVREGDIAFDLLKPVKFNLARVSEGAGGSVIHILFIMILLLILKLFIPVIQGPSSLSGFCFFVLSVLLGFGIMSAISLMAGLATFYLMNYWGLYYTKKAVVDFFSGALVPITLLPVFIQKVNQFLPFSDIVYTPTMIYLGRIRGYSLIPIIGRQAMWVIILGILSKLLYNHAVKKVTINGG